MEDDEAMEARSTNVSANRAAAAAIVHSTTEIRCENLQEKIKKQYVFKNPNALGGSNSIHWTRSFIDIFESSDIGGDWWSSSHTGMERNFPSPEENVVTIYSSLSGYY